MTYGLGSVCTSGFLRPIQLLCYGSQDGLKVVRTQPKLLSSVSGKFRRHVEGVYEKGEASH